MSDSLAHRYRSWLHVMLFLSFCSWASASTTAPLFAGTTLTVHGETYNWVSPASEVGGIHIDSYINSNNQSVTLEGIASNSALATASGNSPQGAVSGYVKDGTYFDSVTSTDEAGSWEILGITFNYRSTRSAKYANIYESSLDDSGTETYTGPEGTYQYEWIGNVDSNSWKMYDLTSPNSLISSINFLGYTYNFSKASRNSLASTYTWADEYVASNGRTLKLAYNPSTNQTVVSAWDPDLGSLNSDNYNGIPNNNLSNVSWKARTVPLFTKMQIWVNGLLLNFQSGNLTTNGRVTDQYSGAGINLNISALVHDYVDLSQNAEVTLTGGVSANGFYAQNGSFAVPSQIVQAADPNRSAPFFTGNATTLYYSAAFPFQFLEGYADSQNNRTDVFTNPYNRRLVLTGNTGTPTTANVKMFINANIYSGTFSNNKFTVPGYNIVYAPSQPTVVGAPAYWLKGTFYLKNAGSSTAYSSASGDSLTLGGTINSPMLSGNGFSSALHPKDPGGIFILQDDNGQATIPALIANTDGSLHLSWTAPPTGLPPAVLVGSEPWSFLGVAAEDTAPGESAAYYGAAQDAHTTTALLKIRTDGSGSGSGSVTITDYSTAVSTNGSYNAATRLFQTGAPGNGFPMPVYAVDPMTNHALWRHKPDAGSGLPQNFVIGGQPWWYAGLDSSGNALYQGYYTGQQIRITPTTGVVSMTDPIGHSTQSNPAAAVAGSFLAERRSIRLANGTVIVSGNDLGVTAPVTPEYGYEVHTIAADLDVVGNNLSFGVLPDDASIAGAVFHFSGDATTATLHSILSKPQARWGWWKAGATADAASAPVMWLDEQHKLKLYPSSSASTPGIVLDPAGPSSFKNGLRVPPGGDISMGAYQEGSAP